ncbi:hypothetical protein M2165_004979 [Variovorax sp. TBS-050B]|nr:hypothetical protein [Variovorax sp. TBS-050B]
MSVDTPYNLDAELLEFSVVVGEVAEFGGTHERKVGRVEHHDRPFALEALVADRHELAVVVRGGLEGNDFGIDQGHCCFLGGG